MNIYHMFFAITLFLSGFGFGAFSVILSVDILEKRNVTKEAKNVLWFTLWLFLLSFIWLYLERL